MNRQQCAKARSIDKGKKRIEHKNITRDVRSARYVVRQGKGERDTNGAKAPNMTEESDPNKICRPPRMTAYPGAPRVLDW
jgi:hypothetical protein